MENKTQFNFRKLQAIKSVLFPPSSYYSIFYLCLSCDDVMTVLMSHLNYTFAVIFHSSFILKCHWERVDTCCVNGQYNKEFPPNKV